jgi:hypothetical protein
MKHYIKLNMGVKISFLIINTLAKCRDGIPDCAKSPTLISIHALARRAAFRTSQAAYVVRFQLTPPPKKLLFFKNNSSQTG